MVLPTLQQLPTVVWFFLCATPILLAGCPADATQEQSPVTALPGDAGQGSVPATSPQDVPQADKSPSTDNRQGINIPDSADWRSVKSTPESTLWTGQPGNTYTLTTHSGKPDAPLDDVDKLRDYVRKQAATEQGGIIEANIIQVDDRAAAYFITKDTIPKSRGYRYVGRCVIPFDGGWYELRMDATAVGTTGKREAFLGVQLNLYANAKMEDTPPEAPPTPGSRQGKSTGRRVKGLCKDPYDAKFDSSSNYWITDDPKFDSQFPQHELSRLRREFPRIIESIIIP